MIIGTNPASLQQSAEIDIDQVAFVRWAVHNEILTNVNRTFFIDLFFDGVFVNRWQLGELTAGFFTRVEMWDQLSRLVSATPGSHTLSVVVDSTDLIPETREDNNTFQVSFSWVGSGPSSQTISRTRLPDLAPADLEGWPGAVLATSHLGATANGPLSVDVPTYVSYGFQNKGLTSVAGDISVHLYLDDKLVDLRVANGLLSGQISTIRDWAKLLDVTRLSPGSHTLRLIVDPANLVQESDETNNTFETQLTWATGPVPGMTPIAPPPEPTAPAPLSLPNLAPGWPFGEDGPIVASHTATSGIATPLPTSKQAFVQIVVANLSTIDSTGFGVDFYFDDQLIRKFDMSGLAGGFVGSDWDSLNFGTNGIVPGPHVLKIVIDPSNVVQEANEDDNVYEATFSWGEGEQPQPTPIVYSQQDLTEELAGLRQLVDSLDPVIGPGRDLSADALRLADAGYFLLTGQSVYDERLTVSLLPREEYLAWIDDHFAERFALADAGEYPQLLARRENFREVSAGIKTRRFGKVAVAVDASRPFSDVLNSLAHELGHAREDFLNREAGAGSVPHTGSLAEAQAQQFERAFWLALEEFTGLPLLNYPSYAEFAEFITERLDFWLANRDEDEHWMGYLVQWLSVLDDPGLADVRGELVGTGALGADSTLRLFRYLVDLPVATADAYVDERLDAIDDTIPLIRQITESRLDPGLAPDDEGPAGLWDVGLLTP